MIWWRQLRPEEGVSQKETRTQAGVLQPSGCLLPPMLLVTLPALPHQGNHRWGRSQILNQKKWPYKRKGASGSGQGLAETRARPCTQHLSRALPWAWPVWRRLWLVSSGVSGDGIRKGLCGCWALSLLPVSGIVQSWGCKHHQYPDDAVHFSSPRSASLPCRPQHPTPPAALTWSLGVANTDPAPPILLPVILPRDRNCSLISLLSHPTHGFLPVYPRTGPTATEPPPSLPFPHGLLFSPHSPSTEVCEWWVLALPKGLQWLLTRHRVKSPNTFATSLYQGSDLSSPTQCSASQPFLLPTHTQRAFMTWGLLGWPLGWLLPWPASLDPSSGAPVRAPSLPGSQHLPSSVSIELWAVS